MYFRAYPSLRTVMAPWLDPKPLFTTTVHVTEVVAKPGQTLESIWHPPPGMPMTGAVYQVDIPGVRSGFAARPGYLYLPPAYLASPRPQLPVLVLLAGFSEGGTCAIQLSTQAPRLYPFFVDISGQSGPTLGSRQLTISRAFRGDAAAFARVDPLAVLAHARFPHNAGVFVGGANDRVYTPQQRIMYLAARHAGMKVAFMDLPGGHNWRVWRGGLEHTVAWLASRLSITGRSR